MGVNIGGQILNKFCYLPQGWNDCWQAAKAASGATPAWMTAIGDSILQGLVASDFNTNGFFGKIKTYLKGLYPVMGDFYLSVDSLDYLQTEQGQTYNGTPTFTVNSQTGKSYAYGFGYGAYPVWSGNAGANIMSFVTPYSCTGVDIVYMDAVSGTWKYSVDGGALQTVTNTGAGYQKRIQITGLSNATHTIVFGTQSADYTVSILGCVAFVSRTAGLGYAGMGIYGLSLDGALASGSNIPADRITAFQGKASATTGFGFPTQPSLAICEYGINDLGTSVAPATFLADLVRVVQAFRRGRQNCSIILIGNSCPDGVNSDVTSSFPNATTWYEFLAVMAQVAQTYNCAFVNIHAKWGETGVAQGFQTALQPHPNDAGHADIAKVLNAII